MLAEMATNKTNKFISFPANWQRRYDARLQHALLHMNYHVHPVVNDEAGERRVLSSCRPKDKRKECKSGFPLDAYLSGTPIFVCNCIADERGFVQRGTKNMLGKVLPKRNSPRLNAESRTWIAFAADN